MLGIFTGSALRDCRLMAGIPSGSPQSAMIVYGTSAATIHPSIERTTMRLLPRLIVAAALCQTLICSANADELASKKSLTLAITKKIAAAAESYAKQNHWNVVIAIVDEGGHLIYLQRMDNVQTGSIEVAIRKAKSAAAFKRPGKVFSDAVEGGRNALIALPGSMPFDGGVPIVAGEQVVGAIGVSGVTGEQDGMIANAGAKSLERILKE